MKWFSNALRAIRKHNLVAELVLIAFAALSFIGSSTFAGSPP